MAIAKKIRVLVVDDSMLFVETISKLLSTDESFEIVGSAQNGADALYKANALKPDIITLDIEMPVMDGLTFLKNIFPVYTCPVVVVTSLAVDAFEAMSLGAVDFVRKPVITKSCELEAFGRKLRSIIKIASNAKIIKTDSRTYSVTQKNTANSMKLNSKSIIAIGASTGGTEALPRVLTKLPYNSPPVVVVVHMPEGFTSMFAQRLNGLCKQEVCEAVSGQYLKQSQIVIARGGKHMRVFRDNYGYFVSLAPGEKVKGHCPSVEVLFDSVAAASGRDAVGVILTGMGSDGASGLLAMRKAGAYTIGQDEDSCVVYGMPRVAYNIGAVCVQKPVDEISDEIVRWLSTPRNL